jgi:GNAT superfamily N-acetyltransferase
MKSGLTREEAARHVRIVDFEREHADAFKRLNYAWIEQYFAIEDADREALEDPFGKVLDPGGAILMALYDETPVGCCALIPSGERLELAKMAVAEPAQGLHIGWLLGEAVLERARKLGASRVYLESNTVLEPALKLYRKLGFEQIEGTASPYARANIQMELVL